MELLGALSLVVVLLVGSLVVGLAGGPTLLASAMLSAAGSSGTVVAATAWRDARRPRR